MMFCSPTCRKWTTFTVTIVFLVLGILLASLASMLFQKILKSELSVKDSGTEGFQMWKETPIPMYLEFYMFNWTNAEEYLRNPRIKPIFQECGPYVFYEHHTRENITFNDCNNTITYFTKRTWKYEPDKTNGSLSDLITTVNPILTVMGKILKYKHILVRIGANILIEEMKTRLFITKPVEELLFEGYDDPLLDLVTKLNFSAFHVPFKKFGWFVDRNESIEYDGVFNMNTGGDDINKLGILRAWNYNEKIPIWPGGDCDKVNGTSGELWYPPHDAQSVKIFSPDLCSTLDFELEGNADLFGITGHKYVGTSKNFDNGTLYPEMKCYFPEGVEQPSGVRNVSLCKFGAPALISFAHFYAADPYYLDPIEGLSPDEKLHQSSITLEPELGLPLSVDVKIQLNLLMQPVHGITVLTNVSTITMPAFWFRQTAQLTEDLSNLAKLLLVAPSLLQYTGFGFIGLSILIGMIGAYVTYRRGWMWTESEEEQLLSQRSN